MPLLIIEFAFILIYAFDITSKNFWAIFLIGTGILLAVHLFGFFCCRNGQDLISRLEHGSTLIEM